MRHIGEKLYLALPAFRDVGATIKGLKINRERYGRHYREACVRILDRDRWTCERMAEYQTRGLSEIIDIAAHHVPYYRELFRGLGLSAQDVKVPEDLRKLPILEKSAVRAHPLRFVDERLDPSALLEATTTGTTGEPTRVLMTRRVRQEHYAFFEARCRRVAGLRYGQDSYATFGARHVVPLERTKPPFWCYNYAGKQLYMSAFHLAPKYLPFYCEELKQRPYRALMGYPSVMSTIARHILDEDIRDIRIPVAITSGETLQAHQRKAIEKAFDCRVFDQYGCAELAVFAAERRCGRMHLSPDYSVVEIVDDSGEAVARGEVGHLVCTGLVNDAQLLLRYRVGDMASWQTDSCDCGSALPTLGSLDGRSANAMILPDGRAVFRVGTIAEDIPCVTQYQIVQEDIGVFCIYVVASEGFTNSHREELVRNLTAHVGRATIRVELVNALERGPGGKFAFIVSRVPRSATSSIFGCSGAEPQG